MSRILALTYRSAIVARRNVFAIVEMLFWPSVSLLSMGLMGDFLRLEEKTLAFIITGAIASGVLQVAQLDVAYGLVYDIWGKSLKHTFLAPLNVFHLALGPWIVGIIRGVLIFAILCACAHWAFEFSLPGPLWVSAFLAGIFLTALLTGLWVWIMLLAFGHRAEISTWAFAPLLMLVCGMYYPVEMLPPWLACVARFLPLTYVLEAFRAGYGFSISPHWLLKMLGLFALYLGLMFVLLNQSLHRARIKGTLVRLSE